MATTNFRLVRNIDGIPTVREVWQDEIERPDKERLEREREIRDYLHNLAELNEQRKAEIAAIQAHGRKLNEVAQTYQQQLEEREREQAEANELNDDLEREFRTLAEQWQRETMMMSSDADITANFAYHQIMGMGEKAVPLILRELQEHGGRWFWALRAITRQNPVRPEDRGNTRRMIQAWLEWGKQNGYV